MESGNMSSASAVPSRYVPIDITGFFNANSVGSDGNMANDYYSFDGEVFPRSAIIINTIPFRLPEAGVGADCISCVGQRIPIDTPGNDYVAVSVHLFATSVASAVPGDYVIVDSEGAESRHKLVVPAWWEDVDKADRLEFDHMLCRGETVDEKGNIWRKTIHAICLAKPKWLTLPDLPKLHIHAITIKPAPDHERNPIFCAIMLDWYCDSHPQLKQHMINWKHAAMVLDLDEKRRGDALVAMYTAARTRDEQKFAALIADEEKLLHDASQELRKYTISYIGNAHIDLAWMWRKEEALRVCHETWAQAHKFMEEFPQFVFAQSQAAAYLWMKERHPETYADMQRFAKTGQWDVVGGTWVEQDCNMPSGESHVRQYLYGKRFFQREFGVDVKVAWNPDTFGYNWNLPQIMRKAGIEYHLTHKLTWNDTTEFPHDLFRWRAPDGSEVLSLLVLGGYSARVNIEREYDYLRQFEENTGAKDLLRLYGIGDHGGGPSREDIGYILEAASAVPFLKVRTVTPYDWFKDIAAQDIDIPVWEDELYLETHRGCLTTQGRAKKHNRRGEVTLTDTEKLAAFAWLRGAEYPCARIEDAWRILMFNQFHDILPGSSIGAVYEDAEKDYAQMYAISDEVREATIGHLGWKQRPLNEGDVFVVVNTLSWTRTDIAQINAAGNVHVVDAEGCDVPCQRVDADTLIFVARDVPSLGWKTYTLAAGAPAHTVGTLEATGTSLESDAFRVEIDPATGTLTAVRDKKLQWDVIAPGQRGNMLQLYDDHKNAFDAWNIQLGDMRELVGVDERRVVERGPVRATMRIAHSTGASTITQDISVYEGIGRIDFRTHIDWREKHKLLKVAFPLNVDADRAWYEIPFAAIARPNKPKTDAEKAKWEVAALNWGNLSADGKSASILNDCKYGYDCKENVMRLSILRAPEKPDPHTDEGEHTLTYSLYTSEGDWRNGTVEAGRELNTPLLAFAVEEKCEPLRSLFAVEGGAVILEAIKKAEDSDSLILRLFEYAGSDCTVRLELPKPPKRAVETDILERDLGNLHIDGDTVVVPMGHHAIVTIKIDF